MSDSMVWVAAGKLYDGKPVEDTRLHRIKAKMIQKEDGVLGFAGDVEFTKWRSSWPADLSVIMFFDRRISGTLLGWTMAVQHAG